MRVPPLLRAGEIPARLSVGGQPNAMAGPESGGGFGPMMEEMMKKCCGEEGIPDFEKMN